MVSRIKHKFKISVLKQELSVSITRVHRNFFSEFVCCRTFKEATTHLWLLRPKPRRRSCPGRGFRGRPCWGTTCRAKPGRWSGWSAPAYCSEDSGRSSLVGRVFWFVQTGVRGTLGRTGILGEIPGEILETIRGILVEGITIENWFIDTFHWT